MYNYWGYGLAIASEIEFPELLPYDSEQPDVLITLGKTPENLTGADVIKRVNLFMSPSEYLLKFVNVANYYVSMGNRIIVEPMATADKKSIRLFLLSNAMAAILHQRDTISLHASAIEHNGGLVLFCGQSGTGKSTTATMFQQKGFKIISDDVCVLKMDGDILSAVPSYPMMKLWEDSFAKAGLPIAEEADKIRPHMPKYARFFHDNFDITPKPVKKVFVLENRNVDKVTIEPLNAISAFKELQKNTYRLVQMNAMQKRNSHFAVISKLTVVAQVYKICRPNGSNTLSTVIDLVTQTLNGYE